MDASLPLSHPRLWIVATPLGNIGDISQRARDILASVDLILAEDTRRAERLLASLGLGRRPLLSFFDHNEEERLGGVLTKLREGQDIALISDAGTPLLADPGYRLVRACRREGIPVSPVPGPSAPVTALSAAGIPPLPYTFLGFLPREESARRALFATYPHGSLVFFERANRLVPSLALAYSVLGKREMVICRELTKVHEEFIVSRLENHQNLPSFLGELTVVIGPREEDVQTGEERVTALLREALLRGEKPRRSVQLVKESVTGWSSKALYSLLETIKNNS
ncbi:MAG: 16S rRNA (cytidine(1402)-2'-O)-methyltransferase [Desulfovibrio sp.]|nr:16S rRNA (cytidine(1402)-2'-O)-methyltransferase [Desulfovibrio sp.]